MSCEHRESRALWAAASDGVRARRQPAEAGVHGDREVDHARASDRRRPAGSRSCRRARPCRGSRRRAASRSPRPSKAARRAEPEQSGIAPWIILPGVQPHGGVDGDRAAAREAGDDDPLRPARALLPHELDHVLQVVAALKGAPAGLAEGRRADRLALREQELSNPRVEILLHDSGPTRQSASLAHALVGSPLHAVVGSDGERIELEAVVHEEEVAVPGVRHEDAEVGSLAALCRDTRCSLRRAGTGRPPGRRRASARDRRRARRSTGALTSRALPGRVKRTSLFAMNTGVHSEPEGANQTWRSRSFRGDGTGSPARRCSPPSAGACSKRWRALSPSGATQTPASAT